MTRRGRRTLTAAGALLVLAVVAAGLTRSPAKLAATAGHVLATATVTPTPSTSVSRLPAAIAQPTQAPQANAAAVAPAAGGSAPVAALLSIPRIGIRNAPIYDRGTNGKGEMQVAAGYAVTHYLFSAPYGTGNTVLYGHDDIQGSIFAHLYDLQAGDLIQITVGGEAQTYRVIGHEVVAPTAVGVLAPTSDVRLTLITCWPYNVDTKRWIVAALKV